jgi:hypothetical protein
MVSASDTVQALAILLILIGTSIPPVSAGLKALGNYRALHALRPLWEDLTEQVPAIVLGAPPSKAQDLMAVRDVRQRLLRRTIEIRDAALMLRGLVDHAEQESIRAQLISRGLTGDQLEAGCEAAWMRSAVAAKKVQRSAPTQSAVLRPRTSTALDDEVHWLQLVATFYRSPETTPAATAPALAMES